MVFLVSEFSEKRNLLKKLKNAGAVCFDCSNKYGDPSPYAVTCWMAQCSVCNKEATVSDVRDSRYLSKGIRLLSQEIERLKLEQRAARLESSSI